MKKLLTTALILCAGIYSFAQTADNTTSGKSNKAKTAYVADGGDNWFLSLNGGIQVYHGDNDKMATFGQRVTPYFDITAGKWFIPGLGIRFGLNGFSAKGATATAGIHSDGTPLNGKPEAPGWLMRQQFPYINAHVDLGLDVLNLFRYNPNRRGGLQAYIGPGLACTWDKPQSTCVSFNGSLYGVVAVSKAIDINLGVQGMFVGDEFDGELGGRKLEGVGAVTIGLTWHIANKGWKTVNK